MKWTIINGGIWQICMLLYMDGEQAEKAKLVLAIKKKRQSIMM